MGYTWSLIEIVRVKNTNSARLNPFHREAQGPILSIVFGIPKVWKNYMNYKFERTKDLSLKKIPFVHHCFQPNFQGFSFFGIDGRIFLFTFHSIWEKPSFFPNPIRIISFHDCRQPLNFSCWRRQQRQRCMG